MAQRPKQHKPVEPIKFSKLGLAGGSKPRVWHDEKEGVVLFARDGGQVPTRDDYLVGVALFVVMLFLYVLLVVVTLLVAWIFDVDLSWLMSTFFAIGAAALLILPFVRRWGSSEGRRNDRVRNGSLLTVKPGPLATRVQQLAEQNAPGYYDLAEQLAKIDALRAQANELELLRGFAPAAGARAQTYDQQMQDFAHRLQAAADDREKLLTRTLTEVHGA